MNGKLLLILVFVTGLGISNVGAQTEIIVETNQSSFQQGQAVIISGNAGQGSVAIQVKEPTGIVILVRSVTTDSDGNFELKFRLSPNAILGDYQAIASVVIVFSKINRVDSPVSFISTTKCSCETSILKHIIAKNFFIS